MNTVLKNNETLTAVLAGAVSTTEPGYTVDYVNSEGVHTTDSGSLSGATAVTLVSGSILSRRVVGLTICNIDTAAATVTLKKVAADATSVTITKIALAVLDTLIIDATGNANVIDQNGNVKLNSVTTELALVDDSDATFGTGSDAVIRWSTGDASNNAMVIGLGDTNEALHITDKAAVATDWNVSADTHPTVYVHSNTTPATDYLKIGGHDGTTALMDVQGGTTLAIKAAGNEIVELIQAASAVNGLKVTSSATGTPPLIGSNGTGAEADIGVNLIDSNGNELIEVVAVASATNGLKITNASTANPVRIGANGTGATANRGVAIDDSNGNELLELVSVGSATNGLKITNATTGNPVMIGADGTGATANRGMRLNDSNGNELLIGASTASAVNEITVTNNATGSAPSIASTGGDTDISLAVTGKGAGSVNVTGLAPKSSSAAAITTTRTLTAADSGGCFSVAKTTAYAITLPTPAQGLRFKFMVLDTGANAVTISDASAHLFGVVSVNNTNVAMTGTTLSLAATGSVGDWVEFEGIDATHYLVTGACIAAADITIA